MEGRVNDNSNVVSSNNSNNMVSLPMLQHTHSMASTAPSDAEALAHQNSYDSSSTATATEHMMQEILPLGRNIISDEAAAAAVASVEASVVAATTPTTAGQSNPTSFNNMFTATTHPTNLVNPFFAPPPPPAVVVVGTNTPKPPSPYESSISAFANASRIIPGDHKPVPIDDIGRAKVNATANKFMGNSGNAHQDRLMASTLPVNMNSHHSTNHHHLMSSHQFPGVSASDLLMEHIPELDERPTAQPTPSHANGDANNYFNSLRPDRASNSSFITAVGAHTIDNSNLSRRSKQLKSSTSSVGASSFASSCGNTTLGDEATEKISSKKESNRIRNREHSRRSREKKKNAIALVKKENAELRHYQVICENAMDLIALVFPDPLVGCYVYKYVSSSYQRELGLNAQYLVNTNVLDLVHTSSDKSLVKSKLDSVASTHVSEPEVSFQIKCSNGSLRNARMSLRLTESGIVCVTRIN